MRDPVDPTYVASKAIEVLKHTLLWHIYQCPHTVYNSIHTCVYIFIWSICMYIYIHTQTVYHIDAHVRTHTYIYIYIYIYICICIYLYIYIYIYGMHMFTYMCIHIIIYTYIYMCVCVYTCLQTIFYRKRVLRETSWSLSWMFPKVLSLGAPRGERRFWCFFGDGFPAARYLVKPNYQNNNVYILLKLTNPRCNFIGRMSFLYPFILLWVQVPWNAR